MAKKDKPKAFNPTIGLNRKARHDFSLEEKFEAGLVLEGWEVKSLRAGHINLTESYVLIRNGEAFLFGAHISPLSSASTHINPDPIRSRKLLLHRRELNRMIGSVERQGYTLIPLAIYWKKGRVKVEIALGKGKKLYDKRQALKERDWGREKQRLMKPR